MPCRDMQASQAHFVDYRVPVITDAIVDPARGTGPVKLAPTLGFNDYNRGVFPSI